MNERRDGEHRTPLIVAALYGDADAARRLLALGASVQARDKYNRTPLIAACAPLISLSQGSIETVRLLLEHGSDIDAQNRHGLTALMEAAARPRSEHRLWLVQLLLGHQPDLTRKDKRGRTAAAYADAAVASLLSPARMSKK